MKKAFACWEKFWFSPVSLYNVGLFRMLLAATLFVMYGLRILDFQDFYSEAGYLPPHLSNHVLPGFLQSDFAFFFVDTNWSFAAHVLYLILLLLMVFGLIGRNLTWLAWVLHLGFLQRNLGVVYGADLFANFWLLYLSLIQHNRYSTWLKVHDRPETSDFLSSVGIRLIQIQLCISYAYTGIEKLKGTQWWDGTAVWYVLGMPELLPWDLTFLQNFPLFIGALTIMTVIFEIYFPAAVWVKGLKMPWLLIGLMFHGMTAIFMSLPFFCLVMTTTYVLLLTQIG